MENLKSFEEFINEANRQFKNVDELIKFVKDTLTEKYPGLKPRVEIFKPGIVIAMFNRPLRPTYQSAIVDDMKEVFPPEFNVRFGRGASEGSLLVDYDFK